jgi:mono/diheme cytochrome c family protein
MIGRAISAMALAASFAACTDRGPAPHADPEDEAQVALGAKVYAAQCAACHGKRLEGQPDWRRRMPNGRLPAPPHDATGHTWHHREELLFNITKYGLVPPHAPEGYQSDMPAFAGRLSDAEIYAALAYIMSQWPKEVMAARAEMLGDRPR